jgi:hypothetical protein
MQVYGKSYLLRVIPLGTIRGLPHSVVWLHRKNRTQYYCSVVANRFEPINH